MTKKLTKLENKKNIASLRSLIYEAWIITDKLTVLNETENETIIKIVSDILCEDENNNNCHSIIKWSINKLNERIRENSHKYNYSYESFKNIDTDSDVISYSQYYEPRE